MAKQTLELDGKVAIITGAAGLIGSETAKLLAAEGAHVVLGDVAVAAIDEQARQLRDLGLKAAAFAFDLNDDHSIGELVKFTVAECGGVDIVDNNAGATTLSVQHDQDLLTMSLDKWDLIYAINVRGPMCLIKGALPAMIERGGGAIINISSDAADMGDDGFAAYGSSKAALNALTKYVATAFGKSGVRCNAVSPGPIRNPDPAAPKKPLLLEQLLVDNCLTPRLGAPRDIAEAVLFLASDRSSFITGQVLSVNGGFNSHWPTLSALRDLKKHNAGGQS